MTLQLSNRAQPRFSNDFLVAPVPNGQATQDEAEFMRALDATVTPNDPYEGVLTKIARLNAEDAAQPDGALKTELQRALQEAVSGMRAVAQRVTDGRSPRLGVADLFVWEGRCSQQREQLSSSRFVVTSDVSPQTGLVQDVNVWVNPNPIEAVTPAQQDLFVAMGETSSIVRIVCDGWDKKERRRRFLAAGHRSRAEGIQHEYLSNVSSIGGFGLFGSQVDFATKALAWLQSDFAAMAAPRVKILYLASLARWCGPAFLILFGCYLLVGFDPGRGLGSKRRRALCVQL